MTFDLAAIASAAYALGAIVQKTLTYRGATGAATMLAAAALGAIFAAWLT